MMNRISFTTRTPGKVTLALAFGLTGLFCGAPASAGCSSFDLSSPSPMTREAPARTWEAPLPMSLTPAVYRPGSDLMMRVSDDGDRRSAGIVGMWRFSFVSDGNAYPVQIPYGAQVDFGTQQWHDDGTEFIISGGRAPSSGDVCMGVWEKTGPRTYRMKHLALAYVSSDSTPPASPAMFLGPAIMHEKVVLSPSGKSFEGTFTIDQFAKDEITLIEHISGTVTATRFTVD
jgi:hypothetical protein